jgi:hypothetical protein
LNRNFPCHSPKWPFRPASFTGSKILSKPINGLTAQ